MNVTFEDMYIPVTSTHKCTSSPLNIFQFRSASFTFVDKFPHLACTCLKMRKHWFKFALKYWVLLTSDLSCELRDVVQTVTRSFTGGRDHLHGDKVMAAAKDWVTSLKMLVSLVLCTSHINSMCIVFSPICSK